LESLTFTTNISKLQPPDFVIAVDRPSYFSIVSLPQRFDPFPAMKIRFLAFLAAIAAGSAAVLIYASQSRQHHANASLGNAEDCSACETSAARLATTAPAALESTDSCCASEAAKPAVATLDAAGCPYVAGDTNAAMVAAQVEK
jgi:hypothetical protein